MTPTAKTEEIVSFLVKFDRQNLERLTLANPGYAYLFKEGETLGAIDVTEEKKTEELKVKAEMCRAALDSLITQCAAQLPDLKQSLKNTNTWQLAGQIVTTIAGASLLAAIAKDIKIVSYITGGLALLGGLFPLIISLRSKTLDENKGKAELYRTLVDYQFKAVSGKRELDFFIKHGFNEGEVASIITECNKLCADLTNVLSVV